MLGVKGAVGVRRSRESSRRQPSTPSTPPRPPPPARLPIISTLMSLLSSSKKLHLSAPRLEGKEVLTGPDPAVCKVKGVMFGGRKQFLLETLGEAGFQELLAKLSARTAQYTKTPLASAWCEFASLIELDR